MTQITNYPPKTTQTLAESQIEGFLMEELKALTCTHKLKVASNATGAVFFRPEGAGCCLARAAISLNLACRFIIC